MSEVEPMRLDVAARDPHAEPVCLLDRDWAALRLESPEHFLLAAVDEKVTDDGFIFRFQRSADLWRRLEVFVAEERECCPFFAFEAFDDGDEVVLRMYQEEAPV
jgi:hypothetical protein